jgi:hemoglobin-like flavoprotein
LNTAILPFELYLIHHFLSSCRLSENNNHRLFALEPEAKKIFGLASLGPILPDELAKSKRFIMHAKFFIQMIEKALGMLGPDIELLTEMLLELGGKHVGYGVKPEYFPSMGQALLFAVKDRLGDDYTDEVKDAWVEVYGALSLDMIRGQKIFKSKE